MGNKSRRKYAIETLNRNYVAGKRLPIGEQKKIYRQAGLEDMHYRKDFTTTLYHLSAVLVLKKAEGLLDGAFGYALQIIAKNRLHWLRPIDKWKRPTRNPDRQFAHLIRYLFASYPVPAFMDEVFFRHSEESVLWFIHVAQGGNLRNAPEIPAILTKKMAHFALVAPGKPSLIEAIRYGQIKGLDGDQAMFMSICATKLGREMKNEKFWLEVIHFFVRNVMLDRNLVGPIIDYISFRKFGLNGDEREALKPDFSIMGRSVAALIRNTEAWHSELALVRGVGTDEWDPLKIGGLFKETGTFEAGDYRRVVILQLCSAKELAKEGRLLRHCVGSYAYSCSRGQISIWSMRMFSQGVEKRMLTIEVDNAHLQVQQIRGFANRRVKLKELKQVKMWCEKVGLSIARYI